MYLIAAIRKRYIYNYLIVTVSKIYDYPETNRPTSCTFNAFSL